MKRVFVAHQIRDRELACRDLKERLRPASGEELDRLCDAFAQEGNLPAFYEGVRAAFVESRLAGAYQLAEEIMKKVGVEYAVAVEEKEKDITR